MALLSAVPVSGGEIKTIHIVTPAWPDQTNEDGNGLFFDIVRSIYEPAGIKMKYEIVPWKRAELMLNSNRADAMVDLSSGGLEKSAIGRVGDVPLPGRGLFCGPSVCGPFGTVACTGMASLSL